MHCQFVVLSLLLGCGFFKQSIDARLSKELLITLPNGSQLMGRALRSLYGRVIKAYMGIPYAQPPIGDLRFKNPLPAKPWEGILDATKDSQICIQIDPFTSGAPLTGSEDCLYLNVYAPHLRDTNKMNLPVMVWIHGGGFQSGSGTRELYAPDYLLDHDIILVTANYRLGPFGFLSSAQEDCPGNFGMKDQVKVLQWVGGNIATFGGDPKSVTVFGQSAGGASVTYLMLSPLAKGLFAKAIAQSGSYLNAWAQPAHDGVAAKQANKLAEIVGCEKSNAWKQTISCLRSASAEDIIGASQKFFEWDIDPMVAFPPVVEPDLPGAFITKHPRDENEPHGMRVPFLTGLTSNDGAMKSAAILNTPKLLDDFSKNYERILPIALYYDHHSKTTQSAINKRIIEFYFNNETPSMANRENITNLFSDGWFLEGFDYNLRKRLTYPKAGPTFVYLFSHKGAASFTELFRGGRDNYYGVSHADDLLYLFPMGQRFFHYSLPSIKDEETQAALTELWVNFARTGNPTPSSSKLPKWMRTRQFPLDYYRIGNLDQNKPFIAMETGLNEDRAQFWREIGAHLPANFIDK